MQIGWDRGDGRVHSQGEKSMAAFVLGFTKASTGKAISVLFGIMFIGS